MKKSLALRLIVLWNAVCATWMLYVVCIDLVALARGGDAGGYGIFVDRKVLIMVSAMPLQVASAIALMGLGRTVALAFEIPAALAYCLVTFGLWRGSRLVRAFAVAFFAVLCLLLGLYLGYIVPLCWSDWGKSLGSFAIVGGLLSLLVNGWIVAYLLRPSVRRSFFSTA